MKSKTVEIIKREYITRVRKRSFIIMTLLMPVFILLFVMMPYIIGNLKSGVHKVGVLDESGYFKNKFRNSKNLYFTYVNSDLESMKKHYKESFEGFLYIPKLDIHRPLGIKYYSDKQPGLMLLNNLKTQIEAILKDLKLREFGLDKEFLKKLETSIDIDTIDLSSGEEKSKNSKVAAGLSYIIGFILYILLMTYGSMVMKGVQEEKNNKIVEIIISSVKPTQLMMGKIIGLALVALTQILIWLILGGLILTFATLWILPSSADNINVDHQSSVTAQNTAENLVLAIKSLDFGFLSLMLIIFGIGGFLFYSSIFAAVGALTDEASENQSITFPVMLPIIIAFLITVSVMEQPNGQIAFWASLIPFFSPIVMMSRIPFGVPMWQIALSIALLLGGIYINILISAKIYRTAILLYGKKITFKEIFRWLFEK